MPLDATPTVTYPALRDLRDLLLDRKRWPKGFVWNFASCRTCAMGLLMTYSTSKQVGYGAKTMEILDISHDNVCYLFGGKVAARRGIAGNQVTPEMVAADIDEWLNSIRKPAAHLSAYHAISQF